MGLLPTPLVIVRRLPNLSAGSPGYSAIYSEERKQLADAGITSYVKLDRIGSIVLVVPEEQAIAARRLLSDSPELFKQRLPPPCPRCHTFHPAARPPYELLPIGIGVLAAGSFAVAGFMGLAYGIAAIGVVAAAVMTSHMPPWRCHSCGLRYGPPRARQSVDS